MPEILIFFLSGLAASAVVGLVFYYLLAGPSEAAARRILGQRTGLLWGRSFRIMMFLMAVVGGLSTQWYGCEGYKDYQRVAADRRLMWEKSTTQVSGAVSYAKWFVIVAAGVGGLAIAVLAPRATSASPRTSEPANARKTTPPRGP